MKKFRKFLTMVVLLALPTVLVSCSDDDDGGDSANNSSIVGTWTYSETLDYGDYQEKYTQYLNFDSDGSFTCVTIDEGYGPYVEYGIWKLIGNELTVEMDDYDVYRTKLIYRIEKISSTSMTLSIKGEGQLLYVTMTRCSYSEMEKYL